MLQSTSLLPALIKDHMQTTAVAHVPNPANTQKPPSYIHTHTHITEDETASSPVPCATVSPYPKNTHT